MFPSRSIAGIVNPFRCRANLKQTSQSRSDYGLGLSHFLYETLQDPLKLFPPQSLAAPPDLASLTTFSKREPQPVGADGPRRGSRSFLFFSQMKHTVHRTPLYRYIARKKLLPPPLGHHRALGIVLLQGPSGVRFPMSEVPLYRRRAHHHSQVSFFRVRGRLSARVVSVSCIQKDYGGAWLIKNNAPLGPYSRNMPRALWWS